MIYGAVPPRDHKMAALSQGFGPVWNYVLFLQLHLYLVVSGYTGLPIMAQRMCSIIKDVIKYPLSVFFWGGFHIFLYALHIHSMEFWKEEYMKNILYICTESFLVSTCACRSNPGHLIFTALVLLTFKWCPNHLPHPVIKLCSWAHWGCASEAGRRTTSRFHPDQRQKPGSEPRQEVSRCTEQDCLLSVKLHIKFGSFLCINPILADVCVCKCGLV